MIPPTIDEPRFMVMMKATKRINGGTIYHNKSINGSPLKRRLVRLRKITIENNDNVHTISCFC